MSSLRMAFRVRVVVDDGREQFLNLSHHAGSGTDVTQMSYGQRNALAKRLMQQVRTSRKNERFQYSAIAEHATPRRCHKCTKPATRVRVTETVRGIDKSSKVFCCEECE